MYVKIEILRLDYFRNKQDVIRVDFYKGIFDSINVGKKIWFKSRKKNYFICIIYRWLQIYRCYGISLEIW